MQEIVGFNGVIGSGKTYQRDLLIQKGYYPLDFKKELILACGDLVGYEIIDWEEFKKSVPGVRKGDSEELIKKFPGIITGRKVAQNLGTEVCRKRFADFWVLPWKESASERVKRNISLVAADVRFLNEVRTIEQVAELCEVSHRLVFCNYVSDRYDATNNHASEKMAQHLLKIGLKDGDTFSLQLLVDSEYTENI